MNCDQVFDILTRGPFPTGAACDSAVEAHLSECPECGRLAEALRPAIELFQESVGPEESRDLPGYWSAVATDRKQPIVSFAQQLEAPRAVPGRWTNRSLTRGWSALAAWRMAAMLALGVTLGSLVHSRLSFDGVSSGGPVPSGAAIVPPQKEKIPRLTTAEHAELAVLPAACWQQRPITGPRNTVRGDQLLANADLAKLSCCSGCHNSQSDTTPSAATPQVAQRCQLCHRE